MSVRRRIRNKNDKLQVVLVKHLKKWNSTHTKVNGLFEAKERFRGNILKDFTDYGYGFHTSKGKVVSNLPGFIKHWGSDALDAFKGATYNDEGNGIVQINSQGITHGTPKNKGLGKLTLKLRYDIRQRRLVSVDIRDVRVNM